MQLWITATLVIGFLVYAGAFFTWTRAPLLLPVGMIGLVILIALGWRRRGLKAGRYEILFSSLIFTFALICAGMIADRSERKWALIPVALGSLAGTSSWALLRFRMTGSAADATRYRRDLRWGLRTGLAWAASFSILAALIFVVVSIGWGIEHGGWHDVGPAPPGGLLGLFGMVVGAYFLAGAIAGPLVGLLRPYARWPLGAMAVGIIGGSAVYAAVSPVAVVMEGAGSFSLLTWFLMPVALGLIVGMPVGLVARDPGIGTDGRPKADEIPPDKEQYFETVDTVMQPEEGGRRSPES